VRKNLDVDRALIDGKEGFMGNVILRRVSVHDRYQLELKLGYPLRPDRATRYRIDTYIFAPHSLGVNSGSYPPEEFYRDIQHYVRMKTPLFRLQEVLDSPRSPLVQVEALLKMRGNGFPSREEELLHDQLRVLRAVIKSAMQEHLSPIGRPPGQITHETEAFFEAIVTSAIDAIDQFEQRFRALEPSLAAPDAEPSLRRTFMLTDEAISVLVEDLLLRVHQLTSCWLSPPTLYLWQKRLAARIRAEIDYRKAVGYPSVLTPKTRESYLRRISALKKFTSSVLWLSTQIKREGAMLQHVLYAFAAGVSMVFATLVAFYAQATYGELTMPVFIALVVGYMFKDRIKESGKAISSQLLNRRLYDYRTIIETQDGRRRLGYVREKVAYVSHDKMPNLVKAAREAGAQDDLASVSGFESVLLYAKDVVLQKDAFAYLSRSGLDISAINDIMRFDVRPFLRKMDEPYEERLMLKGETVQKVRCHRTYHLNLVSVFTGEDGRTTCERTLVILDRKGIQRIEQFDAAGRPASPYRPRLPLDLSELAEAE
jgi:hypothetical protein